MIDALQWMRSARESVSFHLSSPNWEEEISAELPFGKIASDVFMGLIESSSSYLEYGAGSSTLLAYESCERAVSIESDDNFLAAVKRRCMGLERLENSVEFEFVHADIGRTGPWGKPIFPSIARPGRWADYPMAPWRTFGPDFRSDLVLVDGRFRVACALAVVLDQPDIEWTLLVDDYMGRSHYEPIAEFALLTGLHGRMAEFKPKPGVSRTDVQKAFDFFASDWR